MPDNENTHISVSYQNKDITSKTTNLPAIEANELRIDNLFQLADGSYALIDYDSKLQNMDKLKYLGYIVRTVKKLYASGIRSPRIRMIVIYTSNVRSADISLDLGCLQFQIEAGFLTHINTDQVLHTLEQKISQLELLTDEEMMLMLILPLTVSVQKKQQTLIRQVIDLAKDLIDRNQQVFVLSGIVTFSDKIISKNESEEIRRWIQMTKVGQIIEEEKQAAIAEAVEEMKEQLRKSQDKIKASDDRARIAELKVCILQMILKGDTIAAIADRLHMKAAEVAELIRE